MAIIAGLAALLKSSAWFKGTGFVAFLAVALEPSEAKWDEQSVRVQRFKQMLSQMWMQLAHVTAASAHY